MSVDVTVLTPAESIFPWDDSVDTPDLLKQVRPVGELRIVVRDGAVAIGGVGDSQEVRIDNTLPVNFSYVMKDASLLVTGAGLPAASNWELQASMVYNHREDAAPTIIQWGLGWDSPGAAGASTAFWNTIYRPIAKLPSFQMTQGSQIQTRLTNLTTNDIAVTINYTLFFLVYTLNQRFDSNINTPLLTR